MYWDVSASVWDYRLRAQVFGKDVMHQWNGAGAPTMPVGCRKSRQAVNAAVRPSWLHRTLEGLGCSALRRKGLCGRRTRFELLPVFDWGHPAERGLWECILIKQQDDGTVCHRSVVGGDDCYAVG